MEWNVQRASMSIISDLKILKAPWQKSCRVAKAASFSESSKYFSKVHTHVRSQRK